MTSTPRTLKQLHMLFLMILCSQPASRIQNWRSTLRWAYVIQVEEYTIHSIPDVKYAIHQCHQKGCKHIQVEFAVDIKPGGIHPTEGLPLLYFDQLNAINNQIRQL